MINCKEILNRHSSRFFDKSKKVSGQIIGRLILAASLAPSGKNLQPWRFHIVREEELILKLAGILTGNKWLATADLLILVYLNKNESYDHIKDAMAIGAAIENMLLEGESNGIASCWTGDCFGKEAQIAELIDYGEALKLMAVVAFGFERRKIASPSKKKAEELVLNKDAVTD